MCLDYFDINGYNYSGKNVFLYNFMEVDNSEDHLIREKVFKRFIVFVKGCNYLVVMKQNIIIVSVIYFRSDEDMCINVVYFYYMREVTNLLFLTLGDVYFIYYYNIKKGKDIIVYKNFLNSYDDVLDIRDANISRVNIYLVVNFEMNSLF